MEETEVKSKCYNFTEIVSSGSDGELAAFNCDGFSSQGFESDSDHSLDSFKRKAETGSTSRLYDKKTKQGRRHEYCGLHECDFVCQTDQKSKRLCMRQVLQNAAAIEEKADYASQRLLSARKLKISELKSEVHELKIRVKELIQENKLLKQTQHRQEKELMKIEIQKSELPQILRSHTEELRVLKKHLSRAKDKYKTSDYQLKRRENELEKMKMQLKRLSQLANEKNLPERDDLRKKVESYFIRLSSNDQSIQDLNKNIEVINKNHKHQMAVSNTKYKEAQKKLAELQSTIDKLNNIIVAKDKTVENLKIYSNRLPSTVQRKNSNPSYNVVRRTNSNSTVTTGLECRRQKSKSIPIGYDPIVVDKVENEGLTAVSTPDLTLSSCGSSKSNKLEKSDYQYDSHAWKTPDNLKEMSPDPKCDVDVSVYSEVSHSQQSSIRNSFTLSPISDRESSNETPSSSKSVLLAPLTNFADTSTPVPTLSPSPLSLKSLSPHSIHLPSPISTESSHRAIRAGERCPDNSENRNDARLSAALLESGKDDTLIVYYAASDVQGRPPCDVAKGSAYPAADDLNRGDNWNISYELLAEIKKKEMMKEANDEEQNYSDSSGTSNGSRSHPGRKKYSFSSSVENLHRGRPSHGTQALTRRKNSIPDQKDGVAFGLYRPSFGAWSNSNENKIATPSGFDSRKAKLMRELFGDKSAAGEGMGGSSAAANKTPSWLTKTSNAGLTVQNFGHSPFAFDEIAPRSPRSGHSPGIHRVKPPMPSNRSSGFGGELEKFKL